MQDNDFIAQTYLECYLSTAFKKTSLVESMRIFAEFLKSLAEENEERRQKCRDAEGNKFFFLVASEQMTWHLEDWIMAIH